jgi:DNA-binding transcriptional MerR regulator
MKISELSERSGVPIPTIKFYIREGLLPPGERTAKTQARYTESHLALLDLARILKDELGMSVPEVSRILAADPSRAAEFLDAGLAAIASSRRREARFDRQSQEFVRAAEIARELFDAAELAPPAKDTAVDDTIAALMRLERVWPEMCRLDVLVRYANVAKEIARFEIPDDWDPDADALGTFKYAVLGTYLFEPLILALRRAAHSERAAVLARASKSARSDAPKKPAPAGSARRSRKKKSAKA